MIRHLDLNTWMPIAYIVQGARCLLKRSIYHFMTRCGDKMLYSINGAPGQFRRYRLRVGQLLLRVNLELRSCRAVNKRQENTVGRRGGTMGHFLGKGPSEVKCLGLETCRLSHACRATSKHMPTTSSCPPPTPSRAPIHVALHSMSPFSTAAGLPQWPVKRPLSPKCTRHAR